MVMGENKLKQEKRVGIQRRVFRVRPSLKKTAHLVRILYISSSLLGVGRVLLPHLLPRQVRGALRESLTKSNLSDRGAVFCFPGCGLAELYVKLSPCLMWLLKQSMVRKPLRNLIWVFWSLGNPEITFWLFPWEVGTWEALELPVINRSQNNLQMLAEVSCWVCLWCHVDNLKHLK